MYVFSKTSEGKYGFGKTEVENTEFLTKSKTVIH